MNNMDFSKCLIDFTKCGKGERLIDKFPELTAFEEFVRVDDDNYIKIAIATADPDSPFIKIKDKELQLTSIFEFIGLKIKTPIEKSFFDKVLVYEHMAILDCFCAYLRFCHDIDWTEYLTTKQTYDVLVVESTKKRQSEEDLDDYVKRRVMVQGHLKTIGASLKLLEAKIFPDSRAARQVALLQSKKIKTYAEAYAEDNTFV